MKDSKQQALNFLKEIKPSDKIALIFHDDLDGFASGILLYDYLEKKGCKNILSMTVGLTTPNWEEKLPKIENKIIIFMDLAPNIILPAITELKNEKVLSIDHHVKEVELPKEVIDYRITNFYTPASRMVYELIGGKYWLSVLGVLADEGDRYAENKDFIRGFIEKEKLKQEKYKQESHKVGNSIMFFKEKNKIMDLFEILKKMNSYSDIKKVYKYAKPVEDEIQKYIKKFDKNKEILGKIIFYQIEPKYQVKTAIINILSDKNQEEAFVFASTRLDKVAISSRCQSGKYNMTELLYKAIKDFDNASCGGHPKASGCSINKKDLEQFKNNLKNLKI